MSANASAETISCKLQQNPKDPKGSFRPAEFSMVLTDGIAILRRDTYFNRNIDPCYEGATEACSYNFGINQAYALTSERIGHKTYRLSQNYPQGHYINIEMKFSAELSEYKTKHVTMYLFGTGGNVSWIDDQEFLCYVSIN